MVDEDSPKSIVVDSLLCSKIDNAVKAALEYEKATDGNRKLGITGEVGEVLVCYQLGLRLMADSLSEGYDAVDKRGKRVQIKTRRSEKGDMPKRSGRLSRFSAHPFDYVLLGLLDSEYRLVEVWRADYDRIIPLIENEERRNPSLSNFINAARKVYP